MRKKFTKLLKKVLEKKPAALDKIHSFLIIYQTVDGFSKRKRQRIYGIEIKNTQNFFTSLIRYSCINCRTVLPLYIIKDNFYLHKALVKSPLKVFNGR